MRGLEVAEGVRRAGGKALWSGIVLLVLGASACGTTRPAPAPAPSVTGESPGLPPIPTRTGPLELRVVHPTPGATIAVRDSTFIYGTTGTGAARLWISGTPVQVHPNGAFLAFLPIPRDGRYELMATTGQDTARLVIDVKPPRPLPTLHRDSAAIVAGSITPRGGWTALPGERITVGFQGTPGGKAALVLPSGERVPLVERPVRVEPTEGEVAFTTTPSAATPAPVRGLSRYVGYFAAEPLVSTTNGVARPTLAPLAQGKSARAAVLELVVGSDTARAALPLNLALADPNRPVVAEGAAPPPPEGSGIVIGRPGPGHTYTYFWPNGTRLTLTGERNGEYRVRLAPDLDAWVTKDHVRLLPEGTPPPGGPVGTVRLRPAPGFVDVRVALPERLPFQVVEGERSIELTIFGGVADTDWLLYGPSDPLIRRAEWEQRPGARYTLRLYLERPTWGYQTFWTANNDLVLRVRRPPAIDPAAPLRGLLIAVDAGHPPGGATGPTGLTEAEANLQLAERLRQLLEAAGARVFMTRTDMSSLSLNARTRMAVEADADILISIHNNAFPDGINPFENNGTSVYYNHPHSAALADSIQQELVRELGLRDLGIGRADLALARPTWMPAVLTETLFLMIPQQETALRDPVVQDRIARAHLRGLEAFLRGYVRQ